MQQQNPVVQNHRTSQRRLIDLCRDIPSSLNINFLKYHAEYRQDLQKFIYEFRIYSQGKTWRIIKTKENLRQISHLDNRIHQIVQNEDLIAYQQRIEDLQASLNKIASINQPKTINKFHSFIGRAYYSDERIIYYAYFQEDGLKLLLTKKSIILYDRDNKIKEIKALNTDNIDFCLTFTSDLQHRLEIKLQISPANIIILHPDTATFAILAHYYRKVGDFILQNNRFDSFTPLRIPDKSEQIAEALVDGEQYFRSLKQALQNAKKKIYILGWLISPEFSLSRPDQWNNDHRINGLYSILNSLKDVKKYMIIFNAPQRFIPNKPQHAKEKLSDIDNIEIILHPNFNLFFDLFKERKWWSHHEKLVIIDEQIAFMGGFDIGYGRYDQHQHRLERSQQWDGVDYCNFRINDIMKPQQPKKCSIKQNQPRMPWHDVGIRLTGEIVYDLCQHFQQYRQFAISGKQKFIKETSGTVNQMFQKEDEEQKNRKYRQMLEKEQKRKEQIRSYLSSQQYQYTNEDIDSMIEEQNKEYLQTYYVNNIQEIFQKIIQKPHKNEENEEKPESVQQGQSQKLPLPQSSSTQHEQQIIQQRHFADNQIPPVHIVTRAYDNSFQYQIVRSQSNWAIGLPRDRKECSIKNAYIELIRCAKSTIYIENQFFMCIDDKGQNNGISKAICQRIINAHKNKEDFKVMVMIPVLPGFDGHPNKSQVLFDQIHNTTTTIRAMYATLYQYGIAVEDYLYFFSLRAHGLINNSPVTEIIYIHSKVMIVDGKFSIIGSANINNRSLLGGRDSQLAVVIKHRRFSTSLRNKLVREHFGIDDTIDCFSNQGWNFVKQRSRNNHNIYKEIFKFYPDDQIKNFGQYYLQEYTESYGTIREQKKAIYPEKIKEIRGHVVPFQKQFLIEEEQADKFSVKKHLTLFFRQKFT